MSLDQQLAAQVRAARSQVDREAGEARAIGTAGLAATARVAELQEAVELHERVMQALTRVGEERQDHAQRQIEGLVTRALQAIFGENLSFHVVQSVRGGQAQVDFVIRSEHIAADELAGPNLDAPVLVDTPVIGARGGGMAAVVGFLLRLVVLLLTPGARRILLLDETFAHVSAEYKPRVAEFLREVCDKAGVQVVMVTHDPDFSEVADASYGLSLGGDGATEVQELVVPG
jgi:ABC-type uncharacterized transport system YnjBCD ATPase subunit